MLLPAERGPWVPKETASPPSIHTRAQKLRAHLPSPDGAPCANASSSSRIFQCRRKLLPRPSGAPVLAPSARPSGGREWVPLAVIGCAAGGGRKTLAAPAAPVSPTFPRTASRARIGGTRTPARRSAQPGPTPSAGAGGADQRVPIGRSVRGSQRRPWAVAGEWAPGTPRKGARPLPRAPCLLPWGGLGSRRLRSLLSRLANSPRLSAVWLLALDTPESVPFVPATSLLPASSLRCPALPVLGVTSWGYSGTQCPWSRDDPLLSRTHGAGEVCPRVCRCRGWLISLCKCRQFCTLRNVSLGAFWLFLPLWCVRSRLCLAPTWISGVIRPFLGTRCSHTDSRFVPYLARVSLFTCLRRLRIRLSSTWRRTSWRSPAVVSRALGCRKTHQLPFPFPWSDETLESFVSLPRCIHHGQIVWVLIEEGGVWCAVLRGVEGPLHSQKHLVEYQTRLAGCTCSLSTARRLGPRWSQFWCQTPETGSVSYCPSFPLPVKFPSENSLLKY